MTLEINTKTTVEQDELATGTLISCRKKVWLCISVSGGFRMCRILGQLSV